VCVVGANRALKWLFSEVGMLVMDFPRFSMLDFAEYQVNFKRYSLVTKESWREEGVGEWRGSGREKGVGERREWERGERGKQEGVGDRGGVGGREERGKEERERERWREEGVRMALRNRVADGYHVFNIQ